MLMKQKYTFVRVYTSANNFTWSTFRNKQIVGKILIIFNTRDQTTSPGYEYALNLKIEKKKLNEPSKQDL